VSVLWLKKLHVIDFVYSTTTLQSFYGSSGFVRDYMGEPVPEK